MDPGSRRSTSYGCQGRWLKPRSTLSRLSRSRLPDRHHGTWREERSMEILHERCAGLDVHKDVGMACARSKAGASAQYATAEFATTTSGLLLLADGLEEHRCTHVAMEATGVYWKPVCWKGGSSCCWSIRGTRATCRGARATSMTRTGWPTC